MHDIVSFLFGLLLIILTEKLKSLNASFYFPELLLHLQVIVLGSPFDGEMTLKYFLQLALLHMACFRQF